MYKKNPDVASLTQGTCCLRPSISCFTQLNTARYTSSSDGTLRLSLEIKSKTWGQKAKLSGRDIYISILTRTRERKTPRKNKNTHEEYCVDLWHYYFYYFLHAEHDFFHTATSSLPSSFSFCPNLDLLHTFQTHFWMSSSQFCLACFKMALVIKQSTSVQDGAQQNPFRHCFDLYHLHKCWGYIFVHQCVVWLCSF